MASEDIEKKYKALGVGPGVLVLSTPFKQGEFINAFRGWVESGSDTLETHLLDGYRGEGAEEGICGAAVMHWLATGSIPSPKKDTFTELAKVQGSFELDPELDYLKWHSNRARPWPNLHMKKDSTNLDLNDRGVFIRFLTDNSGNINTEFKLFLILVFNNGNAHAIGLNLKTRTFFDPNEGVLKIQNGKDAVEDVAYSVLGLDRICARYGIVDHVKAIVFV
jgi:hypothetical protein